MEHYESYMLKSNQIDDKKFAKKLDKEAAGRILKRALWTPKGRRNINKEADENLSIYENTFSRKPKSVFNNCTTVHNSLIYFETSLRPPLSENFIDKDTVQGSSKMDTNKLLRFTKTIQKGNLIAKNNSIDPSIFKKFIRYLHTDEITFNGLKDAEKLKPLAKRYGVPSLEIKCENYLKEYRTLFDEADKILKISSSGTLNDGNAAICLSSLNHTFPLHINILNVHSKLDVLKAVLDWGKKLCSVNNLPVDLALPQLIGPLLKQFDFLLLTFPYFNQFLNQKYRVDNFNQDFLPPQKQSLILNNENNSLKLSNDIDSQFVDVSKVSETENILAANTPFPTQISEQNSDLLSPKEAHDILSEVKMISYSNCDIQTNPLVLNQNEIVFTIPPPYPKPCDSLDESLEENATNSVKFCEIEIPFDETKEIDRGLLTVDMISSFSVYVIRGQIKIHGLSFHLKKTSNHFNAIVPIIIDVKCKSSHFEEVQEKDISIPFDCILEKPIVALAKDTICIKATVENLQLQMCNVCTVSKLSFVDEITNNCFKIDFSSNHAERGKDMPYLISKILYTCL